MSCSLGNLRKPAEAHKEGRINFRDADDGARPQSSGRLIKKNKKKEIVIVCLVVETLKCT